MNLALHFSYITGTSVCLIKIKSILRWPINELIVVNSKWLWAAMKKTLTWLPVKTRSTSARREVLVTHQPSRISAQTQIIYVSESFYGLLFLGRGTEHVWKTACFVVHELLKLNTRTACELAFATCLTHASKLNQFMLFSACGLVSQQGWMPLKHHTELIKKAPSCHWWILNGFNTFGELPHACAGLQTETRCEGAGWVGGGLTTGSESVAGISCKGSALRVRRSW